MQETGDCTTLVKQDILSLSPPFTCSFIPIQGGSINLQFTVNDSVDVMQRLRRVSARPYTANIVKQFLSKKGRVQIEHPSFSPDLNPSDFFQFPRLKLALKGKRFDNISDIQLNVTRLLNSISKEDFLRNFQDMYSRFQWSIVMGGDYFEGQ
ncbi:histone-lysine N-methyltransferase SETMAR [Trichonephila clavipes]|nr:histone-lysine N-methyltransferase SETMAR [Trichonephila clavipes]